MAVTALGADRLAPDEMVARQTNRAPALDGELTDEIWQAVPRIDGFADPGTGGAPFRATWMKAAYDAANLYLAVWCSEPVPARIRARGQKDRDVWKDDSVEVFIRHTSEPSEHLQLITNTKDVHEDYQHLSADSPGREWDSAWETRAKIGANSWTTEIRIPLAELGVGGAPVRGDFLAFKLGREMWSHLPPDMPGTAGRVCMWPKGRTYSGSSGFGRLYFGAKNLLVNTEFTGVPNKQGFYPSWHGKPGTHGFTP
ncbi:MAG: hypothetical protein HN742_38115 [Lentisphaerae bacterium]|jgi:hypothetical protein|nr:hypothetical protein [Lentisphaerota bacterium]MBT4821263.1 hypothetical protein [Lentisphaerota bacterium]MBT5606343.1 hypothetical protein [Lentisphaerota bacterium]MBT7059623.1 hypothetical protein [Lentisphaerota bacterium]MBT7847745.1 hypothetical protein [Lentisphaerota bacterium]